MTARAAAAHLAHIRRHAIKSAGGEALESVSLSLGRAMPGDRIFAVLHAGSDQRADADASLDRWLPKSAFLRGVAGPSLQAITGGLDDAGWLNLDHPDLGRARFKADAPETARALADWLAPLWPAEKPAPTRMARAAEGAPLTDSKHAYISILSLSTLAALEKARGRKLGIHRWRANLWVEGWEPRIEEKMVGTSLDIGPVQLRVAAQIGRCNAVSVDTETGKIDTDMPAFLKETFGHTNFGIYAEVTRPGTMNIGDRVALA